MAHRSSASHRARGTALVVLVPGMILACLVEGSAAPPRRGAPRLVPPSIECPEPGRSLPEGASQAVDAFLGPGARPLCLGDLNGNGRAEILAAHVDRSYGKGMGFYWVTHRAGLFEAGAERAAPWRPLLLLSDGVENTTSRIGWKRPVEKEGIGLRYTMTDEGRICLQLRRLDANVNRLERPFVLIRWDPAVERYEQGRCAEGTRGELIRDR